MNFSDFLIDCYDDIYIVDGLDAINHTLNGTACDLLSDQIQVYRKNKLTRISTFLGFPNRELVEGKAPTKWNLFYNFIGVKPDSNELTDIPKIIITIPVNVLTLPYKFFRNILKLVTEFLPYIGLLVSDKIQNKFKKNFLVAFNQNKILPTLLWGGLYLCNYLLIVSTFETLLFIGRAITSPILNILLAWHGNGKAPKKNNLSLPTSRLGKLKHQLKEFDEKYKISKVITVLCSIAATAIVYSILLPYLTAWIAPAVMPFLATHCPLPIANAANWLAISLESTLSCLSQNVLIVAEPLVTFWINFNPYVIIASMQPIIGAGLIAGGLMSTLGTGIFKITDIFRNWWWQKPIEQTNTSHYEKRPTLSIAKLFCCLKKKNSSVPASEDLTAKKGTMNKTTTIIDETIETATNPFLLFSDKKRPKSAMNDVKKPQQNYAVGLGIKRSFNSLGR